MDVVQTTIPAGAWRYIHPEVYLICVGRCWPISCDFFEKAHTTKEESELCNIVTPLACARIMPAPTRESEFVVGQYSCHNDNDSRSEIVGGERSLSEMFADTLRNDFHLGAIHANPCRRVTFEIAAMIRHSLTCHDV